MATPLTQPSGDIYANSPALLEARAQIKANFDNPYSWLTPVRRALIAAEYGCEPDQVEALLDRQKRGVEYRAERMEREGYPFRGSRY